MSHILEICDLLVVLIQAGSLLRLVYCLIRLPGSEEEAPLYKKRIRNILVFMIISLTVWTTAGLMLRYMGVSFGAAP